MRVAVIDSGGANIGSVRYALERLGVDSVLTADARVIAQSERVILPGVGAAAVAMARLTALDLIDTLRTLQQPLLGICLGMQLLFEGSDEAPGVNGLGFFKGQVRLLHTELKIPHMGWNKLELRSPSPLLEGAEGEYVYFVHSFHAEPEDRSIITSVCDYGMEVTASVGRGKVQAFQFHPEKSSRVGMRLLKNFVEL